MLAHMLSLSRPAVGNDNPYSGSIVKKRKYRPDYPRRAFEPLLAARQWVDSIVQWYNHEQCHSATRFVTPHERHTGLTGRGCPCAWTFMKRPGPPTPSAGEAPRATGSLCAWFTSIPIKSMTTRCSKKPLKVKTHRRQLA
jgi:hypothetical protein